MTQERKLTAAQQPDMEQVLDGFEIGRIDAAGEIGAAMAYELNGPMTALLLYLGDVEQNCGRIVGAEGASLKPLILNAYREAERLCSLIHRIGDFFQAPIPEQAAIAAGRDAIAWSLRTGDLAGKAAMDTAATLGRR